ncbi:MFS peptide transporter [Ascodesmis nigricans]|uniref:MFS peptide transporter n=1 Tax=Ascodesmis nigricans TaxID=341454 RepID=A0A4S2MZR4_9PEZI|nr:MFS peptide transporter [Ascodesmis nigricans]
MSTGASAAIDHVDAAKAEVPEPQIYEDDKKLHDEKFSHVPLEKTGSVPPVYASSTDESELGPDHPTEEEMHTLRRVPGKVPWAAYTIAFVELCERFSYYGTTAVFVNFIQRPLPANGNKAGAGKEGQSGALDYGQRASTGLTTFNSFWSYVMPLVGGYIADEYLGRYNTILCSIAIALVGHCILIVSAIPSVIANPSGALGCFSVGLIIMGIGTGGFKANISPLVAEQYKETKLRVQTLSSGERVIMDPRLTVSRIYMYFYMMINIGSLVGQIGMVYAEKYVGFWLSYLLPTIMFLFCPMVMIACRNQYNRTPPTGSVTAKAVKILGVSMKGRWSVNPMQTYRNMHAEDFWDRAKPSSYSEADRPTWMTFDDEWVDQVRRGFKACGVFLWYPLYWLAYNQMLGNLTSQAATMKLNGIPNDIITNLNPISLIIFIPIFDRLIYPVLRKMKINFTPIKRICGGFVAGCLSMIWTCVVQYYIYQRHPCKKYPNTCETPESDLNVWIQTGSYVLIGMSEIFASITGLEYAFTKAPTNMRSLVVAIFFFMTAISNAIGQAMVALSEDPLLVWNYGVTAVLAAIGGVGFWLHNRSLDKEEDKLNELKDTKFVGRGKEENPA